MNKVRISIAFLTKCYKVNFAVLLVFFIGKIKAANDPVVLTKAYIQWYADIAIDQMIEYKIPASVTLAQAIFESCCGSSYLARKSNNHFGIKCHLTWTGDTVVKSDDTLNECFRKYNSVEDSYTDHSLFLKSRSRYSHLFNLPVTDYKGWCRGLKDAGYATYALYAEELIKIIEENKLYIFDLCEPIKPVTISNVSKEIKQRYLPVEYFNLKDFARADALFINEHDALIQSLDLITETNEDIEDIAEK